MREVLFGLLVLITACGQVGPPANEDYGAMLEARSKAYAAADRAFYERLLTDDFVLLGGHGHLLDRAQYLEAEFGAQRPDSLSINMKPSGIVARRSDETLVLTYVDTETSTVGGQTLIQRSQRLDVYVWRDGQWRLKAMSAVGIPEMPALVAMSAETLLGYAGRYEFAPGLISVVEVDGDHLKEQSTGQPVTRMLPIGPDLFVDPDNLAARISFTRDASGKVTEQIYRTGDQTVRGRRSG